MSSSLQRRLRALESAGPSEKSYADLSLLTDEESDFLCDLAERDLEYLEGTGDPIGPDDLARAAAINARISGPVTTPRPNAAAKGKSR